MNVQSKLPAWLAESYLRQFAAVVLVLLLVVSGVGLFIQDMVGSELKHDTQVEMQTVAELEADVFAQWVEENEQIVKLLSDIEGVEGDEETAATRTETGAEYATEAMDDMRGIERQTERSAEEVASLDSEISRIGEVVSLIERVAEQTNLLALNASIEAASAGEAGKGFAVVAEEIKSLAEEVAASTSEIAELVASIQTSTADAVEDMDEMRERVAGGADTIEEALGIIEEVADDVGSANAGVQSISEATDEQAATSEQVVATVDEVTTIGRQTAAEAQSVSAAAEEQTASLSEVSDSADSLSSRAMDLASLLDDFDLSGTSTVGHDAGGRTGPAMTDGAGRSRGD